MEKLIIKKVEPLNSGGATAAMSFDGREDTGWSPGWKTTDYPAVARIHFDSKCTIQQIRLYDSFGTPTIKFFVGTLEILSAKLDMFKNWRQWDITSETDYVDVKIMDMQGENVVPEIEFWGIQGTISDPPVVVDPPNVDPPVTAYPALGAALSMGTNGFDWIPLDKLKGIVSNLRLYGYLGWTWTPNGIATAPIRREDKDYDVYLKQAKDAGINVVLCSSYAPDWFFTDHPPKFEHQPLADDLSRKSDPASYKRYAEYMFQMAARYGDTAVDFSRLKVDTTPRFTGDTKINVKKSGLGIVKWFQIGNEPNSWWNPAYAQWTPQEYAACVSACCDGHCGTLGNKYGIWNADKTAKIAMAGLADINIQYLSEMLAWFKANRPDKSWPRNPVTGEPVAIDVHWYDNTGNQDGDSVHVSFKEGCAPEQDHLFERLVKCKAWIDANIPGAEFWLSEYGWDTRQPSLQAAPDEQTQAEWITRGMLLALSAGCDRVFVYNAIDENSGGGLYQTCGLMYAEHPKDTKEVPYGPKPAYHAMQQLNVILHGNRVTKNLSSNKNMVVLGLEPVDGGPGGLIGWCIDNGIVTRLKADSLMESMPKQISLY